LKSHCLPTGAISPLSVKTGVASADLAKLAIVRLLENVEVKLPQATTEAAR
jgi:hypothetical protein